MSGFEQSTSVTSSRHSNLYPNMLYFDVCTSMKSHNIRLELSTGTVAQLVKASSQQAEALGTNPGECQVFCLFRHGLSSILTWRSVRWSNFYWDYCNNIVDAKKDIKGKIKKYHIKCKMIHAYIYYILLSQIFK